ncbi:MAG: 2Fe-2S iron-sulfur cluster binding domain-containing protein [Acidaminobacter sp.]|uniref:(2Fe-2S)-binding protein n=1 Tax=Acidaminobacter sp. TaxID=1872102 RepID=UPI0013835CC4|nr:(2Fe-2S)-binding protein [Acidaminobacter sp.]MZQ98987.1 2Fe-2S iron-sulfur cluster binding domain-containing protein [Acidaminobacter sp.]
MINPSAGAINIDFHVNGKSYSMQVEPFKTILEVLRDDLGLTGAKKGCDDGNCGACTVIMDGKAVKACSLLIGQARGKKITTIEGLEDENGLHPLQKAFIDRFAIQCGFCTPGMIMTAKAILDANPNATEEDIREGMHGNICRCTGYVKIVEAVEAARDQMNR